MLYHKVLPLPHLISPLMTKERQTNRHWGWRISRFSCGMWSPVTVGLCYPDHTEILPFPSTTLIFAVLSTGVQTTLCLEEEEGSWGSGEKITLPFSWLGLITIQLRTSISVEAVGSDTRFQRFRFPGLLKRSDEKGCRGRGCQPE